MATNPNRSRPSLLELWFEALRDDVATKGARAVVPYWLALILGISTCAATLVSQDKVLAEPSVTATLYGGVLALDALLLALSWSAFSRIYDAMFAPGFYEFLRKHQMLNVYLFHVGYIHASQIAAVLATGLALIVSLITVFPMWMHQVSFASSIFFSIYAIRQATGSVTLMHDIVWYKALYLEERGKDQAQNVSSIRKA
ncbi:hypothetical protein [Aureimonas leprariae]|uniref:Uncharacterized protein n=1 Tax=Plantimonas leprariae TaxID=2615207 RepID=A0A7V7PME2_9HYPH|nr:hypothetical protein [Aureimonas leprariae]KAB0678047.1 hypothetical protein F6X38_16610 [Aureimonas leprariae]